MITIDHVMEKLTDEEAKVVRDEIVQAQKVYWWSGAFIGVSMTLYAGFIYRQWKDIKNQPTFFEEWLKKNAAEEGKEG